MKSIILTYLILKNLLTVTATVTVTENYFLFSCKTFFNVVVDHSGGLHMGINYG